MTMWSTEKIIAFREQLKKEMQEPKLWYIPTSEKNRDIIVNHPECPYAQKNGNVSEHRYIWWLNHPEDKIEYNEMIHHINGNHQDNRIENLQKVKMKQHQSEHKKLREQKLNKTL